MRAVKVWCETCEGTGTVDNTLGGASPHATAHDPCPDCDGAGYVEQVPKFEMGVTNQMVDAAARYCTAGSRDLAHAALSAAFATMRGSW